MGVLNFSSNLKTTFITIRNQMKFKQVSVFLRHEHCPKSWEKPGYFCPLILLLKLRKWDKLPWAGAFLSQFSCKKLINYAFSYSVKVAPYDYLSETSKYNKLFCALNSYRSSRMNSKSYKIISRGKFSRK